MSDLILSLLAGVTLGILLLAVRLLRRRSARQGLPANAILIDGSNVMHWGGEPSVKVLKAVGKNLEDEGLVPYFCFDANVGYKLYGAYRGAQVIARALNVSSDQVQVVPKGTVADRVILELAARHNLQVVTNDRFRDWADTFPMVTVPDRFRRGRWEGSAVQWLR